jgi:hypothetical protein
MRRVLIFAAIAALVPAPGFAQTNTGSARTGLAGEQGVGNPPATSALPNSSANAPNASPPTVNRAGQPNTAPANSLQFQPNATASDATPNGTAPGPSQRQYGPRQVTPRQYGSDRLNYGSGLTPNNGQQARQQNSQQQNNTDSVGRTMFPPNNRFRTVPGATGGMYGYGASGSIPSQNGAVPGRNRNDPRMNIANQTIQQGFDPNVPRQPTAADINGWRFANQNGTWWYWMPGEYWVSWDGSQWNQYTPAGPPTGAPAATNDANPAPAIARPSIGPATTIASPTAAIPNFQ